LNCTAPEGNCKINTTIAAEKPGDFCEAEACAGEIRLNMPSQSADRDTGRPVPSLIKGISRAHE
jgi:hypothetical protein